MHALLWTLPTLIPALLLLLVLYLSDKNREPPKIVAMTFGFGIASGAFVYLLEYLAARFSGLHEGQGEAQTDAASIIFLFALVAPFREAAKVAATWPAYLSKHFDEPYDGVVYASASALGFAVVETFVVLRGSENGLTFLRALLGLPANVFFATVWGYALGRARQKADPGPLFPLTWFVATVAHGLYLYLLFGKRESTMAFTLPLLISMGVISLFAMRDLRNRSPYNTVENESEAPGRASILSLPRLAGVPSFEAVRNSLRRTDTPVRLRWILFGAFVTLGGMVLGLGVAVLFGAWAHIDFSTVNENDVSTAAPVFLLGLGVLSAFPACGYILAKASRLESLLEPALASALAIVLTLIALGVTANIALLLGLSCAPVAWLLACAGAWAGRTPEAKYA
jgi:RsiW-degrading membrane proteinase PrsW (M82 family)